MSLTTGTKNIIRTKFPELEMGSDFCQLLSPHNTPLKLILLLIHCGKHHFERVQEAPERYNLRGLARKGISVRCG